MTRPRKCKPGSRTAPLPPPRCTLCGATDRHLATCVRPRGTAPRPSDAASEAMVLMARDVMSNERLQHLLDLSHKTWSQLEQHGEPQ